MQSVFVNLQKEVIAIVLNRMKSLAKLFLANARMLSIMIGLFASSLRHAVDLRAVQDNTTKIRKGDVLLFSTLRNEVARIPFFLDFYRKLGVQHFFFVDNGSTDAFQDLVLQYKDVSVWCSEASYKQSNFGMHWLNYLLRKYGRGHWCVTCDPDEFLMFPHCDKRNLKELADFLESERRKSFFCVLLDMYSDKPVGRTHYSSGEDPFSVAPFFDSVGYTQHLVPFFQNTAVQGGVRRRVFFHDTPERSPALNKIPFVRWHWAYNYVESMHHLLPPKLNLAHGANHVSPTGCLCHFKYFSSLADKAKEEMVRKEHFDDSFEYRKYHDHLESEIDSALVYEQSERFKDWLQLEDLGMMSRGQWF